jgi:hypothetical protein
LKTCCRCLSQFLSRNQQTAHPSVRLKAAAQTNTAFSSMGSMENCGADSRLLKGPSLDSFSTQEVLKSLQDALPCSTPIIL